MELSNSEVLFISHILVKLLKKDIEEKNKAEELQPEFVGFKDLVKRKRGRPPKSGCIASER